LIFGISKVEDANIPSGHPAQIGTGIVELVEIRTAGIDTVNNGSGGINLIIDLPLLTEASLTLETVSVYPNPAVNIINRQMFSVLDINSAVINIVIDQEINVPSFFQGIHILKLETNQGTVSRKVLKK